MEKRLDPAESFDEDDPYAAMDCLTGHRVVNHVRFCFLAYWLSARLGGEWRAKGETEEVSRVLRHLQTIRVGRLQMSGEVHRSVLTEVPAPWNAQLQKLGLAPLFASPPKSAAS